MENIQSIKINSDWFYRYLTPESFYKIIKSKGIMSERQLLKLGKMKERLPLGWNGVDYISLSKRQNVTNSSYHYFSFGNYSLIINTDKAVKTYNINVPLALATLPIPIRFSIWQDEYQVKDFIPLRNIIGIKLPEMSITSYEEKAQVLHYFTSIMEETSFFLPFIDIENKKKIPHSKVKEYLLEQSKQ